MWAADLGLFNWKELMPHCPESSQLWETGTTVFVGDWLGTERNAIS